MDPSIEIPVDSIPADLKSTCERILKRAREVRKREPVVAYWCCFSAASASLQIQRSPEGTAFLMKLLTVLEAMKKSLLSPESGIDPATINDEAAGSACVEQLAMRVFLHADDEDRAGKAGKTTIRNFVIAAQYIEVLRCFEPPNGMREEMEQKLQYARWKAGDIAKALREGRVPDPGPPGGQPTPDEIYLQNQVTSSSSEAAPPSDLFPTLPSASHLSPVLHPSVPPPQEPSPRPSNLDPPPAPPKRHNTDDSAAWSTTATPGILDPETDGVPLSETAPSAPSFDLEDEQDEDENHRAKSPGAKAVRFAGPDGAPLSPVTSYVSLAPYSPPKGPPPTLDGDSPTDSVAPTIPGPSATKPRKVSFSAEQPAPIPPPSAIKTPKSPQPGEPAMTPSTSRTGLGFSAVPSAPSPAASRPAVTPSAPPPPPPTPAVVVDTKTMEKAQKHAKWAISALDYEDVETARKELLSALALLG